jgi:NADH dehydrogenase/NADH:ubiquinone oxidoreductase subunit G
VVAAKPAAGSLLLYLSLYAAWGLVVAAKPAAGSLLLYLSANTASRGSAHPVGGSGADPARSMAAGLVQALLMRAGVESNPGPAGQRDEIQRVENEMGRRLSPDELQFVQNQLTRNTILKIQVNQRSEEQKATLKTLQRNIQHAKERDMKGCDPHLLIGKSPAKTAAQRREATRVRLAAPDQREAARGRMAAPDQREATRVRKVVARAGGLTEERKADVAAGKKKNKKTSVYSGDALRNKEIFAGDFIIEPLEEDKSDALGELGSSQCQHCGALRWDCLPNLTCCQVEP